MWKEKMQIVSVSVHQFFEIWVVPEVYAWNKCKVGPPWKYVRWIDGAIVWRDHDWLGSDVHARLDEAAFLQIPAGFTSYLLRPERLGGAANVERFCFTRSLQSGSIWKTPGQRCFVLVSFFFILLPKLKWYAYILHLQFCVCAQKSILTNYK